MNDDLWLHLYCKIQFQDVDTIECEKKSTKKQFSSNSKNRIITVMHATPEGWKRIHFRKRNKNIFDKICLLWNHFYDFCDEFWNKWHFVIDVSVGQEEHLANKFWKHYSYCT
jgi:hypothetical protein